MERKHRPSIQIERRHRLWDVVVHDSKSLPDPRRKLVNVVLFYRRQVLLFELSAEFAPSGPLWSLPCSDQAASAGVSVAVITLQLNTGLRLPEHRFRLDHVSVREGGGAAFACYYSVIWLPSDGGALVISLPAGAKSYRFIGLDELKSLPLYSSCDQEALHCILLS